MTHQELNNLFESAKSVQTQTSVNEVTAWVEVSAGAAAGGVGLATKLKLFIAKKTIIMLGSTLSIIGAVTLTVLLGGQSPEKPEKKEHTQNLSSKKTKVDVVKTSDELMIIGEPKVETPVNYQLAQELSVDNLPLKETTLFITPDYELSGFIAQKKESKNEEVVMVNYPDYGDERKKRDKGSGLITREERKVETFTEIEIDGSSFDVKIVQGTIQKVEVEADDNLQKYIEVINHGNRLVVNNAPGTRFKTKSRHIIYITVVDVSKITIDGVGDVTIEGIESPKFDLVIDGAGDTDLQINCEEFTLDADGVGNVKLSGIAEKAHLECTGVGDIKAYEFIVGNLTVESSSVGNLHVYAENDIRVNANGVGNVHYKGSPEKENIKNSGIGSVRKK